MPHTDTGTIGGDAPALLMRTPVDVDVTPLFIAKGNEIICDIDPPPGYAKGGNIQLEKNSSYTLAFNLRAPISGPLAGLGFDIDQAGVCQGFWSDDGGCPTHETNAQYYSKARLDPNNSKRLLVDVDPPGQEYAVHYRLNFNNKGHFDPIIINQ